MNSWISCCLLGVALLASPNSVDARTRQAPKNDASAEFDALVKQLDLARTKLQTDFEKAKTPEEQEAVLRDAPWTHFQTEFKSLATKAAGTDVAVRAWNECLELSSMTNQAELAKEALDTLEHDYLKLEGLRFALLGVPRASMFLGFTRAEAFLRRVAVESPHHSVQGVALYALGDLLASPWYSSEVGEVDGVALDADAKAKWIEKKHAEGRESFARFLAQYSDVVPPDPSWPKDRLKRVAEGTLFECDHLQVGMVAPDFEATDVDGAKWKLADYRGKVVVVDFWGFW